MKMVFLLENESQQCLWYGSLSQLLNHVVTSLLGGHHHHHGPPHGSQPETHNSSSPDGESGDANSSSDASSVVPCPCHDDDPGKTLDTVKHMAEEMEHKEHEHQATTTTPTEARVTAANRSNSNNNSSDEEQDQEENVQADETEDASHAHDDEEHKKHLMRMSLNTALAIGLHNFPEGLATFVAALEDPKVGAVLAVAIAIHNIPEGLCVAMPIYYATGNKWQAFGWAMLSGIAEPIAGLLGWLILSQSFSDTLYGVLFGMVAGMMVIISVRELLPTAHRYDPDDSVVTYSFVAGMCIMAVSLVLFLL